VVVVTSIVSVTDWVPSLTVKTQWPAATGVTLNVPLPLAGETVAIPVHEFVVPAAAVLTVNVPVNPASVAVKFCAAPAPVAANESAGGVKLAAPVLAGGVGVALGTGVALATGVAVGEGVVRAVPPDPLHAATTDPTSSAARMSRDRCFTRKLRRHTKLRHCCGAVSSC
jgi:hypothetical protein